MMTNKMKYVVMLLAAQAYVTSVGAASFQDVAEVVDVLPRYAERQQCDVVTSQQRSDHNTGGAIVGGLVGGVLGHQVGNGNGKTAATIIGAGTGAVIGDRMGGTQTVQQQNCYLVRDISGYDVTLRYMGKTFNEYSTFPPEYGKARIMVNITIQPRVMR
jgi:uncharacterized protein YcfJ